MTTRDDLNRYQAFVDEALVLANSDLDDILRAILSLPPAQARDELLAVLPALTDQYGDLVANAAAEWYDEIRNGRGDYASTLGSTAPIADVQERVRWAAGYLFDEDPLGAASALSSSVQQFVSYAGRATVARNVQLDPAKPRFGRVPRGARTCAFCTLIASRGWVYYSRESAGEFDHYHPDCDCQIVPMWDADGVFFDGYDPDAMYDTYRAAIELAGSSDIKEILAAMRSLGDFTDSHVHDSGRTAA